MKTTWRTNREGGREGRPAEKGKKRMNNKNSKGVRDFDLQVEQINYAAEK